MSRPRTSSEERRGRVFVLSGPSAVGKTTVGRRVLVVEPRLERVITATTRAPRPHEADGRDYHFLTPEAFAAWRERGEFLEWAEVYGDEYGTPRAGVEVIVKAGKDALLIIDVQGAAQVQEAGIGAALIFLLPPDLETLKGRLRRRATEGDAQLRRRLETAEREMAAAGRFDHQVVNDDLGEAVAQVRRIIADP